VESSRDPRVWIAICVVVGLIGVGAGVGATLLFVERGPQGAQGEAGRPGSRGAAGPAGDVGTLSGDVDTLNQQVADLDSRLFVYESSGIDLTDLDSRLATVEDTLSSLCIQLGAGC
jgi:hypothetical protein